MENYIFLGVIVLFIALLILNSNKKYKNPEEELWDLENELDIPYKDRFYNKDEEEMFYHPVTGYKGNRANMDAYIINREKQLRDETN